MWIAADMVVPPEEMAQVYAYIEDRSLLDALREMGVDPSTVGQQ